MSDNIDPLDRIERGVTELAQRQQWERGNRLGLLWVHALCGLLAGTQMALWGSSPNIEQLVGPWTRIAMALMGTIGGGLLAIGLRRKPRSILLEAIGLSIVGIWDLAMTAGLILARVKQDDYHIQPLLHELQTGYIPAYPSTVYAALFALICIHLSTLRKLRRLGKP